MRGSGGPRAGAFGRIGTHAAPFSFSFIMEYEYWGTFSLFPPKERKNEIRFFIIHPHPLAKKRKNWEKR
jgi:hypothetical protein